MSTVNEWVTALNGRALSEIPAYLDEHSGIPGPRANLPLVDAVVRRGDVSLVPVLIEHESEYSMTCAAALVGSLADDSEFEALARGLATDSRWRVREGVAIGVQHLGDRDVAAMLVIVQRWAHSSDALLQRAAVASVCEPRLLHSPAAATAALAVCRVATERLALVPMAERKTAATRALRQTLGYGWSVAIAAEPARGVPVFLALDDTDADVAWIVAENRRKKRLSALM